MCFTSTLFSWTADLCHELTICQTLRTSSHGLHLTSRMHKDLLTCGNLQKSKVREVCASRSAHRRLERVISTLEPSGEVDIQLALFEINWKHVDHPGWQFVADCTSQSQRHFANATHLLRTINSPILAYRPLMSGRLDKCLFTFIS